MYIFDTLLLLKVMAVVFVAYGIASSHILSLILNVVLLLLGVIGWLMNRNI